MINIKKEVSSIHTLNLRILESCRRMSLYPADTNPQDIRIHSQMNYYIGQNEILKKKSGVIFYEKIWLISKNNNSI